jgi:hypothetical protein
MLLGTGLAQRFMSFAIRAIFVGYWVAACAIVLAQESNAATITVNAPDAHGRTFIDIIGDLTAGDEETFLEKVALLSDPEKIVVTLASDGGDFSVAFKAGNLIRLTGMTTYVPAGNNCTSACAFMWLAGRPRTLADGAHVGFHGVFSSRTGQQQSMANALLGTYLGYLGFSYDAVIWMLSPQPGAVHWLTKESVERYGIEYEALNPPRGLPLSGSPQQQQLPLQSREPARQASLLESAIRSHWAVDAPLNCDVPSKSYSLKWNEGKVFWLDGTGKIDVETVVFSSETEFRTVTLGSIRPTGRGQSPGTAWTYSKMGTDLISVQPGGRSAFLLARCPS